MGKAYGKTPIEILRGCETLHDWSLLVAIFLKATKERNAELAKSDGFVCPAMMGM